MNEPSTELFPLSDNPIIDALTNGTYWLVDSSRTLSWGISDFASFKWPDPATAKTDIAAAYQAFAPYIDLKFSFGGQFSDPRAATTDLLVTGDQSNLFFDSSDVLALGFFPNADLIEDWKPEEMQGKYPSAPGDIWLNVNSLMSYADSYAPGSGAFTVLMHEMGHTLGLKHPHDDGGTRNPTFAQIGLYGFDEDWFTIMSYNDTYSLATGLWHPATPMIGDVVALQYLYGANLATNAGDTTFTLENNDVFQTLFDPSGLNTLDCSTSSEPWHVNLGLIRGGTMGDKMDNMPYDVGYAEPIQDFYAPTTFFWLYGSFQVVKGSPQDDVIDGSESSEVLSGGRGNDEINSMGGFDTLIGGPGDDSIDGGDGYSMAYLSGAAAAYRTRTAGLVRYMAGPEGIDTYTHVNRFHFDDVCVAYDIDGDAGRAYRLYQAAFDRKPDLPGLGYQMNALDTGLSLAQVAANFIASPEFQSKYGTLDDTQFITQLYRNVLDREPDADGLAYHLRDMHVYGESRAAILTHFSESPENQANVIGAIQDGIKYLI
jgi:Ca2+-binding RTX toxin-like protein